MEEVVDGIYREKVSLSYCFVLDKDDGLYLMDAGYQSSGKTVVNFVKEVMKYTDKELKAVIVSHHHLDHTRGLWKLEQVFDVPLYAHVLDVPVILREKKPPHGEGVLGHAFGWILKLSRYHPPRKVHVMTDERPFPFSIIHLPGHTDGHVVIHDQATKTVLCADLFTVGKTKFKLPPRFFSQSNQELLQSIRTLKELIEKRELEVQNVISSHGRTVLKHSDKLLLERLNELLEREGM